MSFSSTTIIAIDPGAKGAICFIPVYGNRIPIVYKTVDTPPIEALSDALTGADRAVAYVEKLGGFIAGKRLPGSSMFKMGHSAGYWEGALAALRVRTLLVRPQDWQSGLPGLQGKKGAPRKRALRAEALRRFPELGKVVTLDTCDALLIADYAMRVEKGVKAA